MGMGMGMGMGMNMNMNMGMGMGMPMSTTSNSSINSHGHRKSVSVSGMLHLSSNPSSHSIIGSIGSIGNTTNNSTAGTIAGTTTGGATTGTTTTTGSTATGGSTTPTGTTTPTATTATANTPIAELNVYVTTLYCWKPYLSSASTLGSHSSNASSSASSLLHNHFGHLGLTQLQQQQHHHHQQQQQHQHQQQQQTPSLSGSSSQSSIMTHKRGSSALGLSHPLHLQQQQQQSIQQQSMQQQQQQSIGLHNSPASFHIPSSLQIMMPDNNNLQMQQSIQHQRQRAMVSAALGQSRMMDTAAAPLGHRRIRSLSHFDPLTMHHQQKQQLQHHHQNLIQQQQQFQQLQQLQNAFAVPIDGLSNGVGGVGVSGTSHNNNSSNSNSNSNNTNSTATSVVASANAAAANAAAANAAANADTLSNTSQVQPVLFQNTSPFQQQPYNQLTLNIGSSSPVVLAENAMDTLMLDTHADTSMMASPRSNSSSLFIRPSSQAPDASSQNGNIETLLLAETALLDNFVTMQIQHQDPSCSSMVVGGSDTAIAAAAAASSSTPEFSFHADALSAGRILQPNSVDLTLLSGGSSSSSGGGGGGGGVAMALAGGSTSSLDTHLLNANELRNTEFKGGLGATDILEDLDMDMDEEEEEVRKCEWDTCEVEFATAAELVAHVNDHMGSGKASYICQWRNCGRLQKPFTKRHKVQNHVRIHTKERPYACTVDDCGKTFSRLDGLNTHIRTHSSIKPYICEAAGCGKAYFHSRSLRKHERIHALSNDGSSLEAVSAHHLVRHEQLQTRQMQPQPQPQKRSTKRKITPFLCVPPHRILDLTCRRCRIGMLLLGGNQGLSNRISLAYVAEPSSLDSTRFHSQASLAQFPIIDSAAAVASAAGSGGSGGGSATTTTHKTRCKPSSFILCSRNSSSNNNNSSNSNSNKQVAATADFGQGMYQSLQSQPFRQTYQQHQQMMFRQQQWQQQQQQQQQQMQQQQQQFQRTFGQDASPALAYKIELGALSNGTASGIGNAGSRYSNIAGGVEEED
ncbi:hypothetical protein BASA83_009315 [Batrachochytrium salamandrivorans]|nr:hypothetical protein BASA83_009315 [Batrachochytrium salamandrivorans]